jgi:hypothetical protein
MTSPKEMSSLELDWNYSLIIVVNSYKDKK